MVDEAVVLEETAVEVEVAPGGPSTFDTDQGDVDPVASMRDQLGRYVKKDQPKTEDEPSKDTEATADVSKADDTGEVPGAKESEPVVDTAEEEVKDTPKELSAREIETAKQLGFSVEDIEEMDPEAFSKVLDAAGRKYNKKMSELGHLQQKLRVDAGKKAEPSTESEEKKPVEFTDDDFDLTGEDGVSHKLTEGFKVLSERLNALESAQNTQEESVLAEQSDAFFAKLDAKEFSQFGAGPTSGLDENSSERTARQEVLDESEMLQVAAELMGKKLGLNQSLEKAVQILHSDNIVAAERRKITEKVSQRRRGAGDKPTQRKAKPTATTAKAEEHAEYVDKAKKHGISWDR